MTTQHPSFSLEEIAVFEASRIPLENFADFATARLEGESGSHRWEDCMEACEVSRKRYPEHAPRVEQLALRSREPANAVTYYGVYAHNRQYPLAAPGGAINGVIWEEDGRVDASGKNLPSPVPQPAYMEA